MEKVKKRKLNKARIRNKRRWGVRRWHRVICARPLISPEISYCSAVLVAITHGEDDTYTAGDDSRRRANRQCLVTFFLDGYASLGVMVYGNESYIIAVAMIWLLIITIILMMHIFFILNFYLDLL